MRIRKTLPVAALFLFCGSSIISYGQLKSTDSEIIISEVPSKSEIVKEFKLAATGIHDPFNVIRKLGSKKNIPVSILEEILFSKTVEDINSNNDPLEYELSNGVYAIRTLDIIGSLQAYKAIFNAAMYHKNADIRGEALKTIYCGYFEKLKLKEIVPEKEAVHALLINSDDTTYCARYSMRIGEIAREGISNITGMNFGDLAFIKQTITDSQTGLEMTIKQYREKWWQENKNYFFWDPQNKVFTIKK